MISFSLPHFNRQRVARGHHPDAAATTDFATLLGCHSHPIASSHESHESRVHAIVSHLSFYSYHSIVLHTKT